MSSLKAAYQSEGVVHLHVGDHPYSQAELDALIQLCLRLPHEDGIGVENRVAVGRIIVDPHDIVRKDRGYAPARVDDPELAQKILDVVASQDAMAFWSDALDLRPAKLQRAQTNFLYQGGEVGFHNDHESNPDYRASIVIGLTDDYAGGEFIAEVAPGDTRRYRLGRGDALVAKPELQHAVSPVESGTRISLVMFLS